MPQASRSVTNFLFVEKLYNENCKPEGIHGYSLFVAKNFYSEPPPKKFVCVLFVVVAVLAK